MGEISDLFNWVPLDSAIQYAKEAALFYVKPKTFFQSLFRKPVKDSIKQIAFYYTVVIASIFLFANTEMLLLVRSLFRGVSIQAIVDVLPVFFGVLFTKRLFKLSDEVGNTLYSVLLFLLFCYVFSLPFLVLLLSLYIKTQEYEFLMIALAASLVIFYVKNVLYAKVFFDKFRHIVVAIFITFFSWNVIIAIIIHLPVFDKYSSNNLLKEFEIDPVYAEYQHFKARVGLGTGVETPYIKFELVGNKSKGFWFGFLKDEMTPAFIGAHIHENISKTDSMLNIQSQSLVIMNKAIDSLSFDRNKIFFRQVSGYYKSIREYAQTPQDKATSFYEPLPIDSLKSSVYIYTSLKLLKTASTIMQDMNARTEAKTMATDFFYYGMSIYWFPAFMTDADLRSSL